MAILTNAEQTLSQLFYPYASKIDKKIFMTSKPKAKKVKPRKNDFMLRIQCIEM